MKTLTTIGLTVLLGAGTAFAAPPKSPVAPNQLAPSTKRKVAKVGEAAPNFTLQDVDGTSFRLADFKGKTVVLQWINPDCPVCRRVTSNGSVAAMLRDVKAIDKDIVFLAINSTHYMDAPKSKAYFAEHEITAPALIDKDGTVGRLYDARTTPHLYVIDGEGVLRYSGAIDNQGRRGGADTAPVNYVVNAVRQMAAGETVAPDSTQPYGCSVKYAGGGKMGGKKGRRNRGSREGGR